MFDCWHKNCKSFPYLWQVQVLWELNAGLDEVAELLVNFQDHRREGEVLGKGAGLEAVVHLVRELPVDLVKFRLGCHLEICWVNLGQSQGLMYYSLTFC